MPLKPRKHIKELLASVMTTTFETMDTEAARYVPPEMKELLEKAPISDEMKRAILPLAHSSPSTIPGSIALFVLGMVAGFVGGMIMPFVRLGSYLVDRTAQSHRLSPELILRLAYKLHKGVDIPDELLNELRDQGWSDDRIVKALEGYKHLPTPSDIVTFLAREVFEPEMIEKWALDSEWDIIDKEYAKKIGLDEETLQLYWRAHWVHPALTQVYRMLHRGTIDPDTMKEFYRLVEIPEFWRDKLTELAWDYPNRIELRMMARHTEMTKDDLMKFLGYAGLKEEFRSQVADFMLIMGLRSYWAALYRNRWITEDELRALMEEKGIEPEIADRIYKSIVKQEKGERLEEHRRLTRAIIIKGLKRQQIDRERAITLLMEHQRYAREEAEFIVDVELATEGSPETPFEFEKLSKQYLRALGIEVTLPPDELIKAEKEYLKAKEAYEQGIKAGLPQEELTKLEAEMIGKRAEYTYELELYQRGGGSPV